MKRRNIVIILVVVLALAAGGYYGYRQVSAQSTSTAANLQTTVLERGTLVTAVSAAGTVNAPQTATLAWGTSGVVGRVNVAVGDVVNAGAVLLELDEGSLGPSILQAQADLLSAQATLDSLLAGPTEQQLAQARLAVIQAQEAVTSAQRSLNSVLNPVSQSLLDQVESAQTTLSTASANLQLLNVSPDIAALQNQTFITNWYLRRLEQIKEESKGSESNPDVQDRIQRAQIDYQAQLDKQAALQLQIDTARATKTSAVDTAQSSYDTAVANLQAAQRGPDQAKVTLYQAKLEVTQANLKQAEADLAELSAGPEAQAVAAARARIASAQDSLNTVRLTAPFTGTVVAIENRPGDSVTKGQTAILLADLSTLEITVDVSEVDINSIVLGQAVNLTADAAPGLTFQGQVAAVSVLGRSQQGVVTFPVTVVIPEPDPALKPGMTAAVAIVTDSHADVLLVPNRALRVSSGQRSVTVLFEGQQIAVPVTIGLSNDTLSEVLDGQLREGDTVVINATTTTTTNAGGGLFGLFGGGPGGGGRFGP